MTHDRVRLNERARVGLHVEPPHDHATMWKCHFRVELRKVGKGRQSWSTDEILRGLAPKPFEVYEHIGNLLMTAGATALWDGLVTAGLATPFNSTNAQIALGDSSTAASAGQTDLQAAEGTTVAVTAATNASPIVLTTAAQTWTVGMVIVVASVGGNTNANGTWELSAVTSTTATLLNSTGNAAYTSGGTAGPINKYRQLVSGAPVVTTNAVAFAATIATINGNYAWNEWGITTGGAATNKQAVVPPTLLNRAVPGTALLTKSSAASATATMTLSLA